MQQWLKGDCACAAGGSDAEGEICCCPLPAAMLIRCCVCVKLWPDSVARIMCTFACMCTHYQRPPQTKYCVILQNILMVGPTGGPSAAASLFRIIVSAAASLCVCTCLHTIMPFLDAILRMRCHNVGLWGATGCGKTEIARRMAKLMDAPFVKATCCLQMQSACLIVAGHRQHGRHGRLFKCSCMRKQARYHTCTDSYSRLSNSGSVPLLTLLLVVITLREIAHLC